MGGGQGKAIAANVGMTLVTLDILRTGANGSVGVTMNDDSLLGAGPNAIVALDHFSFDRTTGQGRFDSRLSAGRLLVVSGRIAKSSPAAMTVRTPLATLAVRGTEFAVVVE